MLVTVIAEIDVNGEVEILEPLKVAKRTRAIITLLDDPGNTPESKGNGAAMLQYLKDNPLPETRRRSAKEIEETIEELRNSWD